MSPTRKAIKQIRDIAGSQTLQGSPERVRKDDIAVRAYARYEARGREPGQDLDDWLEAEREFRQQSDGTAEDDPDSPTSVA
jgi:hypothetical protein